MTYLYGASVQGIQSFIFQTNKLREIVGASQLVDNIFSINFEKEVSEEPFTEFESFCNEIGHTIISDNIIMSASGNIRYIIDEDTCKKVVKYFPKRISNYAPGLSLSQAVVRLGDQLDKDMKDLEQKLKVQRNLQPKPVDTGLMGLGRARRTGGVAFKEEKVDEEFIDKATFEKIYDDKTLNNNGQPSKRKSIQLFEKFSKNAIRENDIPYDISHITNQKDNGWLAIVHADGNGLGALLQNMAAGLVNDNEKVKRAFSDFSKKLEIATKEAAQIAFNEVIGEQWKKEIEKKREVFFPFRPVVLGGDDLTVIIRADLAFDFTRIYLEKFEEKTKERFKELNIQVLEKGLTACAGIAYIKQTYPFHYGVHLAESLTAEAKKYSKSIDPNRAPSSLGFYKVQASFIEELVAMKGRTHFAKKSKVSFDFGPYLLKNNNGKPNIDALNERLNYLIENQIKKSKGISKLRQLAAELHKDKNKAIFMIDRMENVNPEIFENFNLNDLREELRRDNEIETNINDLIVLSSF